MVTGRKPEFENTINRIAANYSCEKDMPIYCEEMKLPDRNEIVDILNEDLTLTGRTYIYTRMLDLMDTQPWFGYGNGTATFFTTYYIHEKLTNTQNGLLNDYIDWGLIGVICLIILTYSVLRSASSRINPFICLIYTYIVLSSIEITLGLRFLAVLPMCMWANKKNN